MSRRFPCWWILFIIMILYMYEYVCIFNRSFWFFIRIVSKFQRLLQDVRLKALSLVYFIQNFSFDVFNFLLLHLTVTPSVCLQKQIQNNCEKSLISRRLFSFLAYTKTYIMVQRIGYTFVVLLGKSYFIRRQKCS